MSRAGIFIGVDRVGGGFPTLNDAAAGARRMHHWAIGQGIVAQTRAILITDTPRRPITHNRILKAITGIVDGAGVEQLILYFSGHGVNVNGAEQWLLSGAPEDASAAVDLTASVDTARWLVGVQHLIVISDACRVAPGGLQIQGIRGASVFPNRYDADQSRAVDQLFACALGRPANEVRDTGLGATHKSLYTEALLDALSGKNGAVLVKEADGYYVRIPHLQTFLQTEVPRRTAELGLAGRVNQNPDAHKPMSDVWLARHESPAALRTRAGRAAIPRIPVAAPGLEAVVERSLEWAMTGHGAGAGGAVMSTGFVLPGAGPAAWAMVATESAILPSFGPVGHESRCGIKVRGARISNAFAPGAQVGPAQRRRCGGVDRTRGGQRADRIHRWDRHRHSRDPGLHRRADRDRRRDRRRRLRAGSQFAVVAGARRAPRGTAPDSGGGGGGVAAWALPPGRP